MIRKGMFCTYKGIEFGLNKDSDHNIIIFTRDPSFANEGFIDKYGHGVYRKAVKPNEAVNCYHVVTKGKMNGQIVDVFDEGENEYLAGTAYSDIAEKLGFQRNRQILLRKMGN